MSYREILTAEHGHILRMLNVMREACVGIVRGEAVDTADFWQMVGFIRNYVGEQHHCKEEDFLFRAIADELGERGRVLVKQGMMLEHELARIAATDLERALIGYEAQPDDRARLGILVAAGGYEQTMRRNIRKEDGVIYPYAVRRLSDEGVRWLAERMGEFDGEALREANRDRQLAELAALEEKYATQSAAPPEGSAAQSV